MTDEAVNLPREPAPAPVCTRALTWLEGRVSFILLSERMCQISTPLFPVAESCLSVYPCTYARVCLSAIPVSFSY